jgi:hypothetical protein
MSSTAAQPFHLRTSHILAREEARRRGDRRIGTEHLLLALLREPSIAAVVGAQLEDGRAALRAIDREALAASASPRASTRPRSRPPSATSNRACGRC